MSVVFVDPRRCSPPHCVSHPEKARELAAKFSLHGWGEGQDPLVGYHAGGGLQLLSGTHRHAAALAAGLPTIPVRIRERAAVEAAVGSLDSWAAIMDASR